MILQRIKQILAIIGLILVLFEIYYHAYEKPRVEQLINDAKLMSLFLMSDNIYQDEDDSDILDGELV